VNVLCPEVRNTGAWAADEDMQLREQIELYGVGNWAQVTRQMCCHNVGQT
jgi:hypothetical protein